MSHSIPKPINEVTSPQSKETEKVIASGSRPKNAGKEVVDISKNTSDPTPPFVNTIQEEEHIRCSNSQKHGDAQAQMVHSDVHDEDNDEDADQYRFVPDWGLRDDLRIFSYRACKELISHLATPVEDKILSSLSNYVVIRRTYQSLGQSILSQAELLKRHELLNHDHVDLFKRSEFQVVELDRLRSDYQREMQKNEGDDIK
ncbi:hypothetical protein Tco_1114065 [Tanacetum coccineum]|uniref:Uncharacterized protein n=1 Tax=Tanacetum coccineum TaxID=301880 RepID=A0ABQ5IU27_9ASTR